MTINLTDPANHPSNGPLTAERIERVIEVLESSLKYRNGSSMDNVLADAVKGLRELRVSREAEPVVLDDLLSMAASAIEDLLEHTDPHTSYYSGVWADVPGKLRAAALQESQKGAGAPQNCRSNENVQVVDRQSVDGVGHPQSEPQNSQQNIPENILTVRGAVTAIRNSGVAIDAEKILAERDALNSPATPDGWVIVPKELTCEMDDAAWQAYHETRSMSDIWEALLAAAPKEVG